MKIIKELINKFLAGVLFLVFAIARCFRKSIKAYANYFKRSDHSGAEILYIVIMIIAIFALALSNANRIHEATIKNLQSDLFFLSQQNASLIAINGELKLLAAGEAHNGEQCREKLYVTENRMVECYRTLVDSVDPTTLEEQSVNIPVEPTKTSKFLEKYQSPFAKYSDQFFKEDPVKGRIALAIAGHESSFGTAGDGVAYYNAWGYGCGWAGIRFNCGWKDVDLSKINDFIKANNLQNASEDEIRWRYAIHRYMEVTDARYLSLYDGSKNSIKQISEAGYYKKGMDDATQQQIDNWVNDIYWFTQQF